MARTPSKFANLNEFVPASPKSLLSMYEYANKQNEELKAEVKILLKMMLIHCRPHDLSDIILDDDPLNKIYEFFVEANSNRARNVPVIVISDSSIRDQDNSASVVVGGRANAGRGDSDGDGEADGEMGEEVDGDD